MQPVKLLWLIDLWPIKKNRKTLSVDIDIEFQAQWKSRRQQKNGAVESAIRLWVDLPVTVQASIMDSELSANCLVELVQEIVDERIEAGRVAGAKLLERQKRKLTQKD